MTTLTSLPTVPAEPAPLDRFHPLAPAARRACRTAHQLTRGRLLDGVACPDHWDTAARADAAFAELFELDSVPPAADPLDVDHVAVERACRGERIQLTPAERVAAAGHLMAAGWGPTWVSRWLHCSDDTARNLMAAATAAEAEHLDDVDPIPPEGLAA